jgi:hypothetical protein
MTVSTICRFEGAPMTGRGISKKTEDLIAASYDILRDIQPATVRGVCYQLFVRGLIANMSTGETQKVSRALVYARENGIIPWGWIVDETRAPERISQWNDPIEYGETILRAYRKDFWQYQPERIEVWSEKGTVRGVLAPVLDEFALTFCVKHGFDSATSVYQTAQETEDRDRPLIVLYVGDWDPSGLCMSEVDLPQRLKRYGANVDLRRIALTHSDVLYGDLPSFPADSKRKDPRHNWYRERYGDECWELDAMPANLLRQRVRNSILKLIDIDQWEHCKRIEKAERDSIKKAWKGVFLDKSQNTSEEARP